MARCCGRPIKRNSVLEELRVNRLAVTQYLLERMLKLSDAGVENRAVSVECNESKLPDECSESNVIRCLETAE